MLKSLGLVAGVGLIGLFSLQLAAVRSGASPPAPGDIEVAISWDVTPGNGMMVTGIADQPLIEWSALVVEVDETTTYTLCVRTVYGESLLNVRDVGPHRYALHGSVPLWLSYEQEGAGSTPDVRLYGRERRMVPLSVADGDGLARYETGQAVVPAGAVYRTEMVNLRPGSGVKASRVCAVWGGNGHLRVVFRDAASGVELGYADLTPERPCSPVWGRVNRPFTIEVVANGTVQLYDLRVY